MLKITWKSREVKVTMSSDRDRTAKDGVTVDIEGMAQLMADLIRHFDVCRPDQFLAKVILDIFPGSMMEMTAKPPDGHLDRLSYSLSRFVEAAEDLNDHWEKLDEERDSL